MSWLCLLFFILGIIAIAVKEQCVKRGILIAKSKKGRVISGLTILILCSGFVRYAYEITDTLGEWLIVAGLFLGAMGLIRLAGLGIEKLTFRWWIILVIGAILTALSYGIISLSISNSSKAMVIGLSAGLIDSVNQVTKINSKYRVGILIETIIVTGIFLGITSFWVNQTKPIRMIHKTIIELVEKDDSISIYEDIHSPTRGKKAQFHVYIKNQEDKLKEVWYYDYFKGNIEFESKETVNP